MLPFITCSDDVPWFLIQFTTRQPFLPPIFTTLNFRSEIDSFWYFSHDYDSMQFGSSRSKHQVMCPGVDKRLSVEAGTRAEMTSAHSTDGEGEHAAASRSAVWECQIRSFVPAKSCERYLLEDCAGALQDCKPWVPVLVSESKKMADELVILGKSKGLSAESTLALVCYTADLRHFGARREQNLYHGVNNVLHNGDGSTLNQLCGYLHFFTGALSLLPKEKEGWMYRGVTRAVFDSCMGQYQKGAVNVWPGITSVSKSQSVALTFASEAPRSSVRGAQPPKLQHAQGGAERGVLMRIWTRSGVNIEAFSWFAGQEAEVVLGPDFAFVVISPLYRDAALPDVDVVDLVQLENK